MAVQVILSDEHCGGQAEAIFYALERMGVLTLIPLELMTFNMCELAYGSDDETVWRYCQENRYLLLTGNRTTKDGDKSLEMVVRQLITPTSLPVLTIGDLNRVLTDRLYCERCAESLADIVMYLEERHLGITRLYL